MKLLNLVDIYGSVFNFTTFGNRSFTTKLGGIFTLTTLALCISLFIVFGHPVFFQLNPGVIIENTDLPYYPRYNLTASQFPVAFRFENEAKVAVNLSAYVYPYVSFIQEKKNFTTGDFITYNKMNLNLAPCSNASLQSESLAAALVGWSCVDWGQGNYTIGGLWDNTNEYVNYFKFTVFFCKYDGVNYTDCSDYNVINNILNAPVKIYLSMMLPDISIDPSNVKLPLTVTVSNYFFTMNPLVMRTDRYYYKDVNVKQDVGWLFEEFIEFTGFSLQRQDLDIQMRTETDYNDPTKIKTLATEVFLINNQVNEYQINFQKIQTCLANMGGVISLFTTLFRILMFYLCRPLRNFDIAGDIFDFDPKSDFKNPKKNNNQFDEISRNNFIEDRKIRQFSSNNVSHDACLNNSNLGVIPPDVQTSFKPNNQVFRSKKIKKIA